MRPLQSAPSGAHRPKVMTIRTRNFPGTIGLLVLVVVSVPRHRPNQIDRVQRHVGPPLIVNAMLSLTLSGAYARVGRCYYFCKV